MTRRLSDALTEVLAALGDIDGRALLDVGCGRGRLAATLCGRGAMVAAVDPDEVATKAAQAAAPAARVIRSGAESLPFDDSSFDGVVMLNSLHHVPGGQLAAALAEIARVARAQAPIVIVEPLAEGGFFAAMRPLDDETEVRAAAQDAIAAACGPAGPLRLVAVDEFERIDLFSGAEAFFAKIGSVDPARLEAPADVLREARRLFALHGEPQPGGVGLRQPHRTHRLVRA